LPNGKEGDYYYVDTPPGAIIVPLLEDGGETKIIMIKQFRYLFGDYSIEFPMGGERENQTIEECALAELEEETGYRAEQLDFVGKCYPYEGLSKDICHIFIARNLKKFKVSFDETEEIEILIKTSKEINGMIERGEVSNGQTLAAWALIKNKINFL
jgi:ADP-ribose pyrophosphatase